MSNERLLAVSSDCSWSGLKGVGGGEGLEGGQVRHPSLLGIESRKRRGKVGNLVIIFAKTASRPELDVRLDLRSCRGLKCNRKRGEAALILGVEEAIKM